MAGGGRKIFRESSLERLSTPDQLDRLVTITSPRAWVATSAIGILLAGVIAWGFLGSSHTVVEARGVLISTAGPVARAAAFGSGRLTEMPVAVGDTVETGEVIARVERPDRRHRIASARAAYDEIAEILARQEADAEQEREAWQTSLAEQRMAFDATRNAAAERIDYLEDKLDGLESREGGLIALDEIAAVVEELGARREAIALARAELARSETAGLEQVLDVERQVDLTRRELETREREIEQLKVEDDVEGRIVAPASGRVVEVTVQPGSRVTAGQTVVGIEASDGDLTALLYVPFQYGKKVREAMAARISPHAIRREEFGSVLGEVTAVSPYPVSSEAIEQQVANATLAEALSGGSASYEARIGLVPAATPSGYAWTSGEGPDLPLTTGSTVDAEIVVREQRPVDLIIPFVRAQLGLGG